MKNRTHIRMSAWLTIVCAMLTRWHGPAATINLFPEADTYIRDTAPVSNFGTANPLLVGIAATPVNPPRQHGLFRFTLDAIPAGAVINSTTLQLIAVAGQRESSDFDLNRLLVNWTEGGATWNLRSPSTPWTTGGAASGSDYDALPSAKAVLFPVPLAVSLGGQPVTNTFSSPGMTGDVQLWLDHPGTNFGWILQVAGGQAGSGRQLASREDTILKPMLTVDYTLPDISSPATPPTIYGTFLEAGTIRFTFTAQSNRTYSVQFRSNSSGGDWSSLTNIPAQSADTAIQITNAISGEEGYFRVRTP